MPYKKMPPQAYTKETLQEAFEWWNQQSEDFRDDVQDKDDLVGYYLKVRRGYSESDVSEVAKASFSSELKGLAKNLDDFEGYQPGRVEEKKRTPSHQFKSAIQPQHQPHQPQPQPQPQPQHQPQSQHQSQPQPQHQSQSLLSQPSVQLKFSDMAKNPVVSEGLDLKENKRKALTVNSIQENQSIDESNKYFKLDPKSLESVKEVKKALNLSSDQEALRAIIALGVIKLASLLS